MGGTGTPQALLPPPAPLSPPALVRELLGGGSPPFSPSSILPATALEVGTEQPPARLWGLGVPLP